MSLPSSGSKSKPLATRLHAVFFLTYSSALKKLVDFYREARKVGVKINQAKTKAMRINNTNNNTFTLERKEIENVDKFPYLGRIVTKEGGSMEDVRNKISTANGAFADHSSRAV
jgi:GTP1/Obg family GTP-binding protein